MKWLRESNRPRHILYGFLGALIGTLLFAVGLAIGKEYISDINVESYNHTPSSSTISWTGYQTITVSAGVASHPGDLGFKKIAQRIIEGLKM